MNSEKRDDLPVKWALRLIHYHALRHYIYPFLVRARRKTYDAGTFWESYYQSAQAEELSDRVTVAHDANPWFSTFHYNSVENLIIRFAADSNIDLQNAELLDVGTGTGHWLDFYRRLADFQRLVGVDVSSTAVEALQQQHLADNDVDIRHYDVSADETLGTSCFDLINAIGVMFHLVNDDSWQNALRNVSHMLKPGGYFVVGGQFGWITRSVQFHNRDSFGDWSKYSSFVSLKDVFRLSSKDEVLVNKRIRSLRCWKRAASQVGLKYVRVYRGRVPKSFIVPENNLLILQKPEDGP